MVYVTGGNNTFGNYNSSSAYVYVSNIDIPTQQITLRKSNGTAFTAISTGSGSTVGYGIANSNVIIFTDIAPGSVVITQDAKTGGAGFGGGVSYPAGWYRATYYGGAIKVTGTATSTPSGLAMAINSALGPASWTPPIRVFDGSQIPLDIIPTGLSPGGTFTPPSQLYMFGLGAMNSSSQAALESGWYGKSVDFWHTGGSIICRPQDEDGGTISEIVANNSNGWPNPIIALGKPPSATLSTPAYMTSVSSLSLSRQVIQISSAASATSASNAFTFYGQVLNMSAFNSGSGTSLTNVISFQDGARQFPV